MRDRESIELFANRLGFDLTEADAGTYRLVDRRTGKALKGGEDFQTLREVADELTMQDH